MKPLIKMKDGLWHTMTRRGFIPHVSWDEAAKTARAEAAKALKLAKDETARATKAVESKREEAEQAAKPEAEKAEREEDENIALVYSELAALNGHRFAVGYVADEYDLEKKDVLGILRKKKVYGGQLT